MTSPLTGLGLTSPVLAAPMSGGPTTPAMVIAAARAGGLGFVAAGYKTPEALAAEISAVRAAGVPFGVNLFAPNPVPVSVDAYRRYAQALTSVADRLGVTLPREPVENDDEFRAKVDLLLAEPVPVASFTFGIPGAAVIADLKRAGTAVVQTVTSVPEARAAADAGVDMLVVQSHLAGGHSATLHPQRAPEPLAVGELVRAVSDTVGLPVIGAGGLSTAADVSGVLGAGAAAAMVGTVLLLADESGASPTHQRALTDPGRTETVVTRAFTGRPARGLRNAFIDTYESQAPLGYPAIHHLTSPLRKAAAAADEPELLHLWAGTGYRNTRRAPTEQILTELAAASSAPE
ncbi:nitronate monooxygenase [Mycolicibacterium pulveris]|uniref:Propionate 3-nitronate monooxygenase n=1 Tax=Mycolicibacterium pulveris TaxID=36813 RepID=A0A7I7UKC6_MYCPV|nr:nitronate monooxygenase [Mycolicibacterium pulveris]MCV6980518.1 nitronate monooxygenase [Mycolicibacterium pulveris]BBY81914.1 oxidoreductase [Mycolicibacterium pulveris]